MRRPSSKQRRFVVLLLALLTFGIAYYAGNRYATPPPVQITGIRLSPAMPVPAFQLLQQAGEPFSNAQLRDHWSLLLLDPQPDQKTPALRKLVQIHNRMADDPVLQRQTLFVYAVKQDSDTMSENITRLGDNFVLLSGAAKPIDGLFEQLGYAASTEDNLVLYLIDPEANIQALYTSELNAGDIAQDFRVLVANQR
jgi:cytochrome oxidase Cu insertion factor (SCO1/SenC/PrrC family)